MLPQLQYHSDYNELDERCACANFGFETLGAAQVMTKNIMLSMCLAASLLSLDARAQDARGNS